VIDDAHWLDRASAQAMAFVARRLLVESVTMLLATREPSDEFAGLPELVLHAAGRWLRITPSAVLQGTIEESFLVAADLASGRPADAAGGRGRTSR